MSGGWWLFVVVTLPLAWLWIGAVVEVLRGRQRPAARRALWAAVLLLVPVLGLAAYVVMRTPPAVRRSGADAGSSREVRLVEFAERRQRGELDDEGYRAALDEVFTSPGSRRS